MAQHVITDPSGTKHIIVAPDTATPEEVVAYARKTIPQKPQLPEQDERITELQKPGAAQRVLRGVPLLGGALDEIGAGADAALNMVSGGRVGEPYDQSLQRRREAIKKSDTESPVRNTADAVLGGVVSAGSLPFFRPVAGNGIMSASANAGINAAPAVFATGFADGEGGFKNRVSNAVKTTAIGAPIAMVAGGAMQGVANRIGGTPATGPARGGNPQPAIARDAELIGVELPQFMEGGRASQSLAGKLGGIPFVGDDINNAVARTRTDLGNSSNVISQHFGGAGVNPQNAGEAARDALSNWVTNDARAVADRVYAPVNAAMQGATGDLANTRQIVGELMRQQAASGNNTVHAGAIREVMNAASNPNGLSYEGMRILRTHIGNMMDNSLDPNNRVAAGALRQIYGGLSRDMEATITQTGGPRVMAAWRRANAVNERIADRRAVVSKLIGADADKSGEGIVERIVSMASTKGSADAARVQAVRRAMGPEAWRNVMGAAIQRLGRNQSNEFSPDTFLKNYSQLSENGRRTLFQSTGDNDLMPYLNALANVSQAAQRFNRLGNPSGSGGVAALLTAMAGAASGDMGATMGTALAGRGIGLLMSRPAVVRNASRHARNMQQAMNGQVSRQAINQSAIALARSISEVTGEDEKEVTMRIMSATP
jgi:hypothetical protein